MRKDTYVIRRCPGRAARTGSMLADAYRGFPGAGGDLPSAPATAPSWGTKRRDIHRTAGTRFSTETNMLEAPKAVGNTFV